jgi:hypothetical protein
VVVVATAEIGTAVGVAPIAEKAMASATGAVLASKPLGYAVGVASGLAESLALPRESRTPGMSVLPLVTPELKKGHSLGRKLGSLIKGAAGAIGADH